MTFYCKPPSGNVNLDIVQRSTYVRLRFLMEILKCGRNLDSFRKLIMQPFYVQNANFLMDGTSLDSMSYFLLSLLTVGNRQSFIFMQNGERQLFEFRLRLNTSLELTKAIKKVSHFVLETDRNSHFSNSTDCETVEIFRRLKEFGHRKFAECVKNPADFRLASIAFPFTSVLPLVAKRRVDLHKGLATVPANSMNMVLLYIFEKFQKNNSSGLYKLQSNLLSRDQRLCKLAEDLQGLLRTPVNDESEYEYKHELTTESIENYLQWFPPCMLNVHRQLKVKHRLKHHARIQYTLFLKELGMPLREAVKFWAHEYSQSSTTVSNDSHKWSRDYKRYGYNLRHLYGLEGAKISYSSHCCRSLQKKIVSCGDDAGCPFSHFDEKNLRIFLAKEYGMINPLAWNEVKSLVKKKSFCKACESVFNSVSIQKTKNIDQFLSQSIHSIGSQGKDSVPRLYRSQPTTTAKPFFTQTACYEHEMCLDADFSVTDNIIKKPSDFYKLSKF